MNYRNIICITLVILLLIICYFSPNYENFENINDYFSNMPGILKSDGQVLFNTNQALYNKDHVSISNGYQPSIIRPINNATFKEYCLEPCYTKNKWTKWCSKEDAVNYYGMRPLVTYNTYNEWLQALFKQISQPGDSVTNILNENLVPFMYCTTDNPLEDLDDKTRIMRWIMNRVAEGVNQLPELQNNGPWKVERFYDTDVDMYVFISENTGARVYKITFNLYNPLRSTSTMVDAVVIEENDNEPHLIKMEFINDDSLNIDSPKAFSLNPFDINNIENTEYLNWNYKNVLHDRKFNRFGFFEKEENIEIQGGVPQEFENIDSPLGTYLSGCGVVEFNGTKCSGEKIPNNGYPQLVIDNPNNNF